MLSNSILYEQGQHGLLLTSLTVLPGGGLMAAAVNGGLFHIEPDGRWFRADRSLPPHTVVHRLETDQDIVYACTDKGLFVLADDGWLPTKIAVACYRLRSKGGVLYAACGNGMWYLFKDSWLHTNYTDSPVFDIFHTPQMIFMAQTKGITVFDRYTQSTEEYPMQTAVSSLCVLHGSLVGASANGDLMVGNKKGNFELVRYGKIKIFSLAAFGGRVYACTDRGLYRLLFWRGKYHLCSVKTGFPVTDAVFDRGNLHLATYFEGVRTVAVQSAF
ncbi:MAG: hypothetical protein K0R57_1560 [Paenibacillaceae bacterium]|nr:hypothetical protein [Paenibacillaceae bacterium]